MNQCQQFLSVSSSFPEASLTEITLDFSISNDPELHLPLLEESQTSLRSRMAVCGFALLVVSIWGGSCHSTCVEVTSCVELVLSLHIYVAS